MSPHTTVLTPNHIMADFQLVRSFKTSLKEAFWAVSSSAFRPAYFTDLNNTKVKLQRKHPK